MSNLDFLTPQEFQRTVEQGITLVDFNAPWCAPCRAQDPILDEIEKIYVGKARIAKINIDNNRIIATKLGIQSIPTLIIFKEGTEIKRFIGLQDAKTLLAIISKVTH